ncbi:hypothetical protein Scep_024015 [Stephania cephalantha]|uniref:Uncharacterized protein n=1 Tax=Stephania cephalantha TaxID=152367 RepID=A0AAP0EVQ9_9MAGN
MDREKLQKMREWYGQMEQALSKRLSLTFVGSTSSTLTTENATPPAAPSVAHRHDDFDDDTKDDFHDYVHDYD